jgi:hypothetical protein
LGDENTKFFHANATIRHNKNLMMCLRDESGHDKFGHDEKANRLWEYFKERPGKSDYSHMYFDLSTILNRTDNLDVLTLPFDKVEIDNIIRGLPSYKSEKANRL